MPSNGGKVRNYMVHQYKLNGYNIILDTCSGSVHTVDEVAYDIIAMYKQATKDEIVTAILEKYGHMPDVTEEEILACIEDIAALEESGKLFSKDQFEGLAYDYKNNSKVVKALCLHVAQQPLVPATSSQERLADAIIKILLRIVLIFRKTGFLC